VSTVPALEIPALQTPGQGGAVDYGTCPEVKARHRLQKFIF